jgi:hypothetical protein
MYRSRLYEGGYIPHRVPIEPLLAVSLQYVDTRHQHQRLVHLVLGQYNHDQQQIDGLQDGPIA